MNAIKVGPADGALILHTTREGIAGRIGHDLTILVERWTATIVADGDELASLRLSAEVDSLLVVAGQGGLKAISDGDRKTIVENARKTLRGKDFPDIVFEANGGIPVNRAGGLDIAGKLTIAGTLTIAGCSRSMIVHVTTEQVAGGTRATSEVQVNQTEFGIKPYSAMLGQLKVADAVRLTVDVVVPSA